MSAYTKEQIERWCKQCGINIHQYFADIEQINKRLDKNPKIKNKDTITKLMHNAEDLIKNKGIIEYETNN